MPDQLERLTSLVALLLETRVPLTLLDIHFRLEGQYPESEQARRASFERDKAVIRSIGIPLAQTVLGGNQAGQTGYWVDRREYELVDLGLADDERRALQVAVAAVHIGAGWADDAIVKLGGSLESAPSLWAATLEPSDSLPLLYEACSEARVVRFTYHQRVRSFEPWGLLARNGFWYVIGRDPESVGTRTYRVNRIEGDVTSGEAGAFVVPDNFDPASAFEDSLRSIGARDDGPAEATVLIDAARVQAVLLELDPSSVVETRANGDIVVKVPCRNRLMFRAWVLGFVDHAEVLDPPEVRGEVVSWLRAMVGHG